MEPVFKTLAPPDGYAYMGPSGAGHYVKMVHNGIEYGLLQAYAEGFELLDASTYDLDLQQHRRALEQGQRRALVAAGAGRARARQRPRPAADRRLRRGLRRGTLDGPGSDRPRRARPLVLAYSLFARFRSRQEESFGAKLIAALRNEFGGHAVRPVDDGK